MRVSDRVLDLLLPAMFVASLLAVNSALALASTYTYYLNGPVVRVNSNSLQGVSLTAAPGTAFTHFQGIGDTVLFSGNSTVSYQTDSTTSATVHVWLCTDVNEAGPSWGSFNFSWSLMDNSTSYPNGIVVASSNFTANLTGDWTLVSDSAPTNSIFINGTDTVQFAIQCTSTSVDQIFLPGWWLSSNSSQGTDASSINITMLQQPAVSEEPFGMIAASVATIAVLAAYRKSKKLKISNTSLPEPTRQVPNVYLIAVI
jgi:hypothetical protein